MNKKYKKLLSDIRYSPWRLWHRTWKLRHSPKHAYWHLTKGFCYCETWSLDYSIAKYALPRLIHLRENTHGVPQTMYPSMERLETNTSTKEDEFIAKKNWEEVLNKIIWSLEFLTENRDYEKYGVIVGKEPVNPNDELDKMCYEFEDFKPKYDWDKAAELDKRCQEGLDLLGKHFQSLWD